MSYVLGVDAGNTKTIALVARLDGQICGTGRAGCADIYGAPSAEAALAEVDAAVGAALEAAGARAPDLAAGAFSMAGADWPEDYEFLQAALQARRYGRRITLVNDAIGALYAGSPDGSGVVVVCGTHTAVGARNAAGQMWHSSFWGESHGARELVRQALRTVYRAALDIDPATDLTRAALDYFDQPTVEDLLHAFTSRLGSRPAHADGFSRVVLDVAAAGDETACRIVSGQGDALGDDALAAARQVCIESTPFNLVLCGGVLRHPSHLLGDAIIDRVHSAAPNAVPLPRRWEPALGALLMALQAAGVHPDQAILDTIHRTAPPLSLFAT